MEKDINKKKFVLFCGGCVKDKCFRKEQGEEVWKHLKGYRKREGYENAKFLKMVCLDMCHLVGPNVVIIDKGVDTAHSLGAKNTEDAQNLLDRLMDERVIDMTPPR
jgi:hypothetical protein